MLMIEKPFNYHSNYTIFSTHHVELVFATDSLSLKFNLCQNSCQQISETQRWRATYSLISISHMSTPLSSSPHVSVTCHSYVPADSSTWNVHLFTGAQLSMRMSRKRCVHHLRVPSTFTSRSLPYLYWSPMSHLRYFLCSYISQFSCLFRSMGRYHHTTIALY